MKRRLSPTAYEVIYWITALVFGFGGSWITQTGTTGLIVGFALMVGRYIGERRTWAVVWETMDDYASYRASLLKNTDTGSPEDTRIARGNFRDAD